MKRLQLHAGLGNRSSGIVAPIARTDHDAGRFVSSRDDEKFGRGIFCDAADDDFGSEAHELIDASSGEVLDTHRAVFARGSAKFRPG